MLHLILLLTTVADAHPGLPYTVDYSVPPGYSCEELEAGESFSVLEADNGVFVIVPLAFTDDLILPVLAAWNSNGDTLLIQPPDVAVSGWFPDSLMIPSFPPYPGYMDIPPGLPEDYTRNISFWLVWGGPPEFPWLITAAGLVVVAVIIFILLRRKRKADEPASQEPSVHMPKGRAAEKEALALLESEHFIHGHWLELYTEVDTQFRTTVAGRFGVVNKALTLGQISRTLASTAEGRKFMEQASSIVRETTLQRYADWGSSRERAAGFIRKLAQLRREWSR
jgi:hypothetical protein